MTSPDTNPEHRGGEEEPAPVIRDKRKIDPETGSLRDQSTDAAAHPADAAAQAGEGVVPDDLSSLDAKSLDSAASALAEERLRDLQRLQAEYVNYRKRVERDRTVAADQAVAGVMESLLPVLDDIELARQHGDLAEGPFAAIAEKLEGGLKRLGLERFGAVGEEFDPNVHEALMHNQSAEATDTTVTMLMQPGYLFQEKVLRPARVGVTSPE